MKRSLHPANIRMRIKAGQNQTMILHRRIKAMTIKELSNPGEAVKVYGLYGKTGKLIGIKKMRGYVCEFESAGALVPFMIDNLFSYVEGKPILAKA
jgi:hypothetical protein